MAAMKRTSSNVFPERDHQFIDVLLTLYIIKEVADLLVFNLKVAKKAGPDLDWNDVSPISGSR
jgi:hypothetical protein